MVRVKVDDADLLGLLQTGTQYVVPIHADAA